MDTTVLILADSPERAAEIDCNEGVLDIIDVKFPNKGTLITPTLGNQQEWGFWC